MGIWVKNLSCTYPGASKPVLKNISFEAHRGELTVIIGPNGVGKSTLLKAVLGLLEREGQVLADNCPLPVKAGGNLPAGLGYMTQEGALLSSLCVLNVVLLGKLGTLGLRVDQEDIEKAWEILNVLHMEQLAQRPFHSLSGGQRRMVDVAQTLMREPGVLVMDEPTANLDMVNELQVMELVKAYTCRRKTATVVTLHDLNMAARYADKIILLKDGTVFKTGAPAEVISRENIQEAYGVKVQILSGEKGEIMLWPREPVIKQEYRF